MSINEWGVKHDKWKLFSEYPTLEDGPSDT